MAQHLIQLGLQTAPAVINNYENIYESAKEKAKKLPIPGVRRKSTNQDQGYQSDNDYQYSSLRSGNMDRQPRSATFPYQGRQRQDSVEDIPRAFPPPGSRYSPRDVGPSFEGRAPRSARDYRPRSARAYDSSSESESSPPPRQNDRRRRNTAGQQDRAGVGPGSPAFAGAAAGAGAYGAARAYDDRDQRVTPYHGRDQSNGSGARDKRQGGNEQSKDIKSKADSSSDSGSDSDSSSLLSSSEDEHRHKNKRTKEFITAGLAAVATVHAASGVYNSLEAREKRMEKLRSGNISAKEARKERTKALLQDAAAVGVAALSIKAAVAKWHGAHASHKERKEHKMAKEERHKKRLERANSAKSNDGRKSIDAAPRGGSSRPMYNRTYSTSEPDLTQRYNGTPGRYVPAQYRYADAYAPNDRR